MASVVSENAHRRRMAYCKENTNERSMLPGNQNAHGRGMAFLGSKMLMASHGLLHNENYS